MQDTLDEGLRRLSRTRVRRMRMNAVLLVLSLIVSLEVFWILRQPGLTLAGDADCRITEHTHDEECQNEEVSCYIAEHVHTTECYSDETADVETQLDWQNMFADYPYSENLRENLAGIAKTQAGYSESSGNFQVGDDGVRRGYTRYGAWYGAPYSDWSAMFVSFCLHYAGADPEIYPGNTGADSMAELWKSKGNFVAAGEYIPSVGDLVFLDDNTVGIVEEVRNATFYVLRGDIEDRVSSDLLSLDDEAIIGWGVIEDPEEEEPPQVQQFLLQAPKTGTDTDTDINLKDYLKANGGSFFFSLQESDGTLLPEIGENQYEVQPGTIYQLTFTFTCLNGFLPRTYLYQLPGGFEMVKFSGDFIIKESEEDIGIPVGTWKITEDKQLVIVFNDRINEMSEVILSAEMKAVFSGNNDHIDFDGNITVTVEKPEPMLNPTELKKVGFQGGKPQAAGTDTSKIYWTIHIIGHEDSQIVGNILTDQLLDREWSQAHTFTESDIANGFTLGVTDPAGVWHQCNIAPDDPNLTWDETGWTYKMPESIICQCGEITLGNEGWEYYVNFSSTPVAMSSAVLAGYENGAWIDGQYAEYWEDFVHSGIAADVIKTGDFRSDAESGVFHWELQVTIPGWSAGSKAEYHWYLMDYMHLLDDHGDAVGAVANDIHLAAVTANYNGSIIQVPEIQNAEADDPFAWENAWTASENGITNRREINLYCRCHCTEENCKLWKNNSCTSIQGWYVGSEWHATDFCQCWTPTDTITFTFSYETKDPSLIDNYGGIGYQLRNSVELYNKQYEGADGMRAANEKATVQIPGVFKKGLGHAFDGYTANYKITVNEAKIVLTDGSPLAIKDVMTDTLAFVSGSLVITAEDADGNVTKLIQDTDYTVAYDGTGAKKDEAGNEVHVLDIVILHPQPVMYILDYDTTLVVPKVVTESIKYSNSATVTLWGEEFSDSSIEMGHANINIAAKSYKVAVHKSCASTGDPLGGAVFGLFNAAGGLIATGETDENGKILFQTNVTEGIILREKTLYYVQELKAPPGYLLDDAKQWFCFCANTAETCEACDALVEETDAFRIPYGKTGEVHASNEIADYDLPATGGIGEYPVKLASIGLIMVSLVYGFLRKRNCKR